MAEMRYCPKCKKNETRSQCSYGGSYWDNNAIPLEEEAPVNAVGGGHIAGVGIGPQGEPPAKAKMTRKPLKRFKDYIKRTT